VAFSAAIGSAVIYGSEVELCAGVMRRICTVHERSSKVTKFIDCHVRSDCANRRTPKTGTMASHSMHRLQSASDLVFLTALASSCTGYRYRYPTLADYRGTPPTDTPSIVDLKAFDVSERIVFQPRTAPCAHRLHPSSRARLRIDPLVTHRFFGDASPPTSRRSSCRSHTWRSFAADVGSSECPVCASQSNIILTSVQKK